MWHKAGKICAQATFILAVVALSWFRLSASVMAICAVVLVVMAGKLESLVEFSFGPLKAKMERNLSESEKLLNGLKSVALAQSKALVSACAHTGKFATNDAWIFEASKDIEVGLRSIGATEQELLVARLGLVTITLRDLGAAATNGSTLPSQLGDDAVLEWKEFRSTGQLSDPDFVEGWLKKHCAFGLDQQVIIEAMRWIRDNNDIRDAEQFMLAKKVSELTSNLNR